MTAGTNERQRQTSECADGRAQTIARQTKLCIRIFYLIKRLEKINDFGRRRRHEQQHRCGNKEKQGNAAANGRPICFFHKMRELLPCTARSGMHSSAQYIIAIFLPVDKVKSGIFHALVTISFFASKKQEKGKKNCLFLIGRQPNHKGNKNAGIFDIFTGKTRGIFHFCGEL